MQQLDLFACFDADIAIPTVSGYHQLQFIMQQSGAFQTSGLQKAVQELQSISSERNEVHVGVKRILKAIELAKQDPDDIPGRFANVMSNAMLETG